MLWIFFFYYCIFILQSAIEIFKRNIIETETKRKGKSKQALISTYSAQPHPHLKIYKRGTELKKQEKTSLAEEQLSNTQKLKIVDHNDEHPEPEKIVVQDIKEITKIHDNTSTQQSTVEEEPKQMIPENKNYKLPSLSIFTSI